MHTTAIRTRGLAARIPRLAAAVAVVATAVGSPATADSLADGLRPEDQRALEAIAALPPELRDAVSAVAARPEVLVRVPGWRMEFEARLGGVLVGLDDADRARFEELARHPYGVAAALEAPGDPAGSGASPEARLAEYPGASGANALWAVRQHEARLRELARLQEDVAAQVETALAPLPEPTRDAFVRVLDEPGLASLLLDHMPATVQLGAAARLDPVATAAALDELAASAARARELERERRTREQAARARAAEQRARREAERRQLRRWRMHWGYRSYRYPYDVYFGPGYDPVYWGWYPIY